MLEGFKAQAVCVKNEVWSWAGLGDIIRIRLMQNSGVLVLISHRDA